MEQLQDDPGNITIKDPKRSYVNMLQWSYGFSTVETIYKKGDLKCLFFCVLGIKDCFPYIPRWETI